MNPTICIVNNSKTVADSGLKKKLRALQEQITRDFEPLWGWGANLKFNAKKFDMKVIIKDTNRTRDLGYHFKDGKPVAYVFAEDDIADSHEYTSTLSHELLEMIADPNVNLSAIGKFKLDGRERHGLFGLEVCDPVQENLYEIDGVRVSDFVVPEWFELDRKKGRMKMDYLGVIDAPFMLAEGGYADVLYRSRWHTLAGVNAKKKRVRHRNAVRQQVAKM